MGCLNSGKGFDHWFGNIHLSGPCNRSCYFCIGQHMMGLDHLNSLDDWPLPGIENFVEQCNSRGIKEVNITGSNTDPALYRHQTKLIEYLRSNIDGVIMGVRTNGVVVGDWLDDYDKGSFSITSLIPSIYKETMGQGTPPDPDKLFAATKGKPWKVNIVLTPESILSLAHTVHALSDAGFKKINIREPYGQEHVGDPMKEAGFVPVKTTLGMPTYEAFDAEVTYWDVHYVHVESVNLYASGRVSIDYPVSKGHAEDGIVLDQSNFDGYQRRTEQWVNISKNNKEIV